MSLFNHKYRVESAPGWYFVTICTKNKLHYFGSVKTHNMVLSAAGKIAESELLRTPEIRDNVVIDAWVIMPNHVHVIFRILPPPFPVETHRGASLPAGPHAGGYAPAGPPAGGPAGGPNRFGPQSNNLPSIVRGFKSAVKRRTNLDGLEFHWQARYHDRIIRDSEALQQIRKYIRQNVIKW